jgi:PTH2 family peptidyl-tRNA hydrolase
MGKGKLAAQVAHASLTSAEEARSRRPDWYHDWLASGQAKVVVKASSGDELRKLLTKAKTMRLPAALVEDRGLTQLEPGTVTCVGIGPAPEDKIDQITGQLKLL